jgi:hypothetical protein
MESQLAEWLDGAGAVATDTEWGADVVRAQFSDGSSCLVRWRCRHTGWRVVDAAGYDTDRIPERVIRGQA